MKGAVVFLIILVAAFVFFALRPLPERPPDWIASLGEWLKPKFDFRDVRPGCLDTQKLVFRALPLCIARFSASQNKYRILALTLNSGGPAIVSFRPAEGDHSGLPFHPVTLKTPKAKTTLVLPRVGGDLTIDCQLGPCSLQAQ